MKVDVRNDAAAYYDLFPDFPDDVPFYLARMPAADASVLELGCGTGRVMMALVNHCGYIHGIDLSPAMIARARQKLLTANVPEVRAQVDVADISDFCLGRAFDLLIAPYRVMQNLELDGDVDGLFRCVRHHLAPSGTCILNTFNPNRDAETLRQEWCSDQERLNWELPTEDGRVTCHDRRPRMDPEKMILYPELIYRRYKGDQLIDETVLKLVMRCYYPQELVELITGHGFEVVGRWGGYAGEQYGQGPELVVQFTDRS